jgi:hypothetical protein
MSEEKRDNESNGVQLKKLGTENILNMLFGSARFTHMSVIISIF